ncbi:MAG: amidohydrolase family protein [Actinomycetota bacterium]
MGTDAASPGTPPGRRARPDAADPDIEPDPHVEADPEPEAGQASRPRAGAAPADLAAPAEELSRQRRNLLLGLGLGVFNVAAIRRLGPSQAGTGTRATEAVPAGGAGIEQAPAPSPSGPVTVPFDPAEAEVRLTSGSGLPPALAGAADQPPADHRYDLAIVGGRVIDPDSRFDGLANIGIDGGTITAVTTEALSADRVIDASGRIVAPGFVDLLSYEPNPFGVWLKLADGVTTNLAMHGVNNYAEAFFRRYENVTPIHFGGAFHHHFLRGFDLEAGIEDALTGGQQRSLEALVRTNLAQGFAGISFSPEYSPGTTTEEMIRLARLAEARGHVCFFHVRHSDPDPPGTSLEAIGEVLTIARATGAAVHIEHLSSTGGTFVMGRALDLLNQARADGIDATACLYPYDFWGTFLGSSRFALGWQERYRLSESDLQVAGTADRLTEDTFGAALRDNKLVAALGSIPEDDIRLALAEPWVMVASDAIITEARNNHPRGAGTFARTIGHYVRDLGVLDLMDGLAKLTILPTRRVEAMIPAMAAKGRVQRGADADLVVFDPRTIGDRATVEEPAAPSVGIDHVLVAGQLALHDGQVDRTISAGTALRSDY